MLGVVACGTSTRPPTVVVQPAHPAHVESTATSVESTPDEEDLLDMMMGLEAGTSKAARADSIAPRDGESDDDLLRMMLSDSPDAGPKKTQRKSR